MPDALSKTVPMWCAVLNIALFGESDELVYLPPHIISASEKSQIEKRIPEFVKKLMGSGVDIDKQLASYIHKPLRPIWVTPDSFDSFSIQQTDWKSLESFHPIILCTASVMVQDNTDFRPGYTYVQGAADDHEEWASLLTPNILWDNIDTLRDLELTDKDLQNKIDTFASDQKNYSSDPKNLLDTITLIDKSFYSIGKAGEILSAIECLSILEKEYDILVNLSEIYKDFGSKVANSSLQIVSEPLPEGKKGSKKLRNLLPSLVPKITEGKKTLIVCDSGSDFSVGVCLALLCMNPPQGMTKACDKDSIRQRLVIILSQRKVNPSRSTLNSVNSYLMS